MILEIISIILAIICLGTSVLCLVYVKKLSKEKSPQLEVDKITNEIQNSSKNQNELNSNLNQLVLQNIKGSNDTLMKTIMENNRSQFTQLSEIIGRLNTMIQNSDTSMKSAIQTLENGLTTMRQDNEKKLDQMRQTVDEKLSVSLENRLSSSFNIINERLQSVYEGIGVMKQLATGVGDLKKVLTNVKTRGTWGEIQLESLLEQILTKDQYLAQVNINPKNMDRVDFVIKMPGKDDSGEIYLPIDAKFPIEDYQRIIDASESGNKEELDLAVKSLEKRVKEEAKKIKEKYILIPKTTDFAVMYVPIEGMYAEILRINGLCETLQTQYKITVCGPTTLSALLNSLQLGFKSLSIEKRSSEVWNLLATFKVEFTKFVDLLAKTQKKLAEASNTIELATKKSRTIDKKLKNVSKLAPSEESEILEIENLEDSESVGEESDE